MGMPKKYANLTDMTQCHSGPRGGSICFRPGDARTGGWWSRFVRPGGLSEVKNDFIPSRDFKRFGSKSPRPVTSPRIVPETHRSSSGCSSRCDSSCQVACEGNCQLSCEQTKQTIAVFDTYEKVGPIYYCRFCEWSSSEVTRVAEHMGAYHPEKVKGPVKEESPESWSGDQHVLDPDTSGESSLGTGSPAVPTSGSPSSRPQELKMDKGNGWWRIDNGQLICVKCEESAGVRWSTTGKGQMTRHAKRLHGYKPAPDRKKARV